MKKLLWLAFAAAAVLCVVFPVQKVSAEEYVPTARFFCYEEATIEAIAEKLKNSDDEGDVVAKAAMSAGSCVLMGAEFFVKVTRHGKTFKGTNAEIEVVEFDNAHEGNDQHQKLYAMLWLNEIRKITGETEA